MSAFLLIYHNKYSQRRSKFLVKRHSAIRSTVSTERSIKETNHGNMEYQIGSGKTNCGAGDCGAGD
ncbi:uncharacterized protein LOC117611162 isoform X2 [Osmia lignaria lignaria]|uniref:uncharacterized protein LOC117611162 isoform X2 n=1 Tax=Osmia lignaria lignaria TaxID=1437193 RepID=UPI001478E204|nr:uncharacterized protein LOC117611162 isoform X2 [Osmia lignaria]XP_034194989.1 uncharacterized protein LOC117611162 isoform X2 [Osmia lignaria]